MAQLNSALDYGSRGYRFESYHGHKKTHQPGEFFLFTQILKAENLSNIAIKKAFCMNRNFVFKLIFTANLFDSINQST